MNCRNVGKLIICHQESQVQLQSNIRNGFRHNQMASQNNFGVTKGQLKTPVCRCRSYEKSVMKCNRMCQMGNISYELSRRDCENPVRKTSELLNN